MTRRNSKKSEFLTAWGISLEVFTDIVNAVRNVDPENADENLAKLRGDKDRLTAIAEIIVRKEQETGSKPAICLPPPHYLVNVNLSEFLLAIKAQMEASGEFGWVSDIFDGRLWYDAYSLDGKDIPNVPSGGETVYLMKDFGKDMSSESAIKWGLNEKDEFAPDGYRPATLAEGRAFAKANPKLQLEHPIVILGSFALDGGNRHVAVLDRHRRQARFRR